MSTRRMNDDDTGIEIMPGVVVVDLTVASPQALTAADLRGAFDEARAQHDEASLTPEDILGDLDLNPL